jgi:hypothetical protein
MYTKVFRQIYDGTLADNWQALVTFQQLLILADADGTVDMTVAAIQRTTGIPLDILEKGVAVLEAPDHGSRTPDMEGRRIVRLDEHRAWGWRLVNFRKYRQLTSREDKNEADRVRIAKQRAEKNTNVPKDVATCSAPSPFVADVAHTEAYTEADAVDQEQSSLRSDSSSTLSLTPPSPPTDIKLTRAARIRQIAEDAQTAFNDILAKPHGELSLCAVLNKDRLKLVEASLPTVRLMCQKLYGTEKVVPEFWRQYFEEVAKDDFYAGRQRGGPGHENWKSSFDVVIREKCMAKIFDQAMTEAA